jgi:membrane peptidoglycan carboxypeptidase
LLVNRTGALVLLNANTGEILAITSHPSFDPNQLDEQATELLRDPQSPLLDRAAQELYPAGTLMQSLFQSVGNPGLPSSSDTIQLYTALGFYTTPDLHLPVASAVSSDQELRVSPLQVALAAAAISNNGIRPAPRLVMAVKTPIQGWVVFPPLSKTVQVFSQAAADSAAKAMSVKGQSIWQWSSLARQADKAFAWSMAGTLPNTQGIPLTVVVLLEDANQQWAAYLAQQMLTTAMNNP